MAFLNSLFVPYLVIVVGGVAHFLFRGFTQGDAASLAKGVTVFALGLGGFIIGALITHDHAVGAIAASAVIGPMAVGGLLLWYFVFRKPARPPLQAPPPATGVSRHRLRMFMPVGIGLGASIPGLMFAIDLIADHHTVAGIATATIMALLVAAALTVRQIIALVEQDREKGDAARRERAANRSETSPGAMTTDGPPLPPGVSTAPHAPAGAMPGNSQTARRSQVETRFVRMTLDHVAGTMSGDILAGPERGRTLDALAPAHLLDLLERWRQEDPTSAVVVESWLDRTRPDWRNAGPAARSDRQTISHDEALAILGLTPGATPSAVKDRHRRLMARVHPDQGGSTWLASKVNEARDALLAG